MILLRTTCALLLTIITGCSSVNPVDSILQPIHDVESLDAAMTQLAEAGLTPGFTVAVVKGGMPVYLKGFGYEGPTQDKPVQVESGFNLWSVSKIFTQLAILDLVDAGRIQLDESLCVYVEWFDEQRCSDANSAKFRTIRMLMNHTAGIPDVGLKLYAETQFDADEIPSQKVLAKRLLEPSSRWSVPDGESRYSNSHYLLLAAIVEHVSGQTFSEFVQARVLDPLGLFNTGYRYPPGLPVMSGSHPVDLMSFFAFFYVDKSRAVRVKQERRYWFNNIYNSSLGSTGVVSNGHDVSNFMSVLLSCLRASEGLLPIQTCKRIIEAESVVVAESPARGVTELRQKLGWFVQATAFGDSYVHGGSGMGYTSMLQLFPDEDLGVFVVANDSYFDGKGGLAITAALAKVAW